MPEAYTKDQVETALAQDGYVFLQESGGLTIYQTHMHPGDDLVIDWSRGVYDWEDMKAQLEWHGIDPNPIHNTLTKL